MKLKKMLVHNLQCLAGKLNFINKAVPQERAFSVRIYWSFKGMKPLWHMSVTADLKKDLQMWIIFLYNYGGFNPIPTGHPPRLQIYTDVSANPNLGWGPGVAISECGESGSNPFFTK